MSRLSFFVGSAWALALIVAAILLPAHGSWTIDDSVKCIAARQGTGTWAEYLVDGPIRSRLSEPDAFPPLKPPFASRISGDFSLGFSPWTRVFFKLIAFGGSLSWRLAPALVAIALSVLLARAGLRWAFLLLPLTFYGLVPWEHALSWLLLWPAVWIAAGKAENRKQKAESGTWSPVSGVLLSLALLLRPETIILAVTLIAYLLWRKSVRKAIAIFIGVALGLGAMLFWHSMTSAQPAFAQIGLNLLGLSARGLGGWLVSRPGAVYGLLLRMDLVPWLSLLLILGFVAGVALLLYARRRKSKTALGLALGILALWVAIYQTRLWSAGLPPLVLIGSNSLFTCLPWAALLLLPPYRNRPAFLLAAVAVVVTILTVPIWEGVHWGPRMLLFTAPILLLDLYQSGRARGTAFQVLLILTAAQTLSSAALVYARSTEMADRFRFGTPRLGTPIICPTMSQCADLAPLWADHEFFTAASPRELRQLLIEMRFAKVDTVWLHLTARDSLYVQAFPDAKPVWPHEMTVFRAGTLYKTQWRIYELVMNRSDSLWAQILETEAGRLMTNSQPESALRLEREAVAVAPGSAPVHNNLALILAALGDTSQARDEASIALQLNPDLREPRRILEMLHSPIAGAP